MFPPEKVIRHLPIVKKWCAQLLVPQSVVLAVIQKESAGNPLATRPEPTFEKTYILENTLWLSRCKEVGITTLQAATSYGLMQLMFTAAWGFNCRNPKDLLDANQNIRFGTALLAQKLKKFTVAEALCSYNGGDGAVADLRAGKTTAATNYSKTAMVLVRQYETYLAGK